MTVSTGPMLSPGEAFEIFRADWEHSYPDVPGMSLEIFQAGVANPWPWRSQERHLGYLDGVPVGLLELSMPQRDNLAIVDVELKVLPTARRRGVGRALFELAVGRARAEGRRHLIAATVQRHPDGAAFAKTVGATPGLEEIRSRLDVCSADQPRLDAMLAGARAHAEGYQLTRWTGVPPDNIIDDVAYLDSRFNSDAPVGDLPVEPEKTDADRIRQGELGRALRGATTFNTGALRDGRLVAWTALASMEAQPQHAWQNITLVDPHHRGRRLGLLVKLANLAFIRESRPEVEAIDTYNAATNAHMLRINREMGFHPVDSIIEWRRTV